MATISPIVEIPVPENARQTFVINALLDATILTARVMDPRQLPGDGYMFHIAIGRMTYDARSSGRSPRRQPSRQELRAAGRILAAWMHSMLCYCSTPAHRPALSYTDWMYEHHREIICGSVHGGYSRQHLRRRTRGIIRWLQWMRRNINEVAPK